VNIYFLGSPIWDYEKKEGDADYGKYAEFAFSGTLDWNKKCEVCWYGIKPIEPIRAAWENGSDIIADITWSSGSSHMLVQAHVKEFMEKRRFNCRFSDKVEYLHNEFLKKRKPHIKLPYTGPKLYWLSCDDFVSVDVERSGVKIAEVCKRCGYVNYEPKRTDLSISNKEMKGIKIFKIKEYGRFEGKFVTEKGYEELASQNYTNLHLRLAGKII
jgi:hypothetical protein